MKQYYPFFVLILAVFVLSGCSDSSSEITSETYNTKVDTPITKIQKNEPIRRIPVIENSETDDYEPLTFKGNDCIDDCSGHEAGYNWAEEEGIIDPSDCGGNSRSFIEGCESYAEEQ